MADEFEISLKNRIKGFVTTLHRKWTGAGRSLPRFKIKNSNWLDLNFNIFGEIENIRVLQPSTSSGRGRPKKLFSESSERSKKRKIKHLAPGSTTSEMRNRTSCLNIFSAYDHVLNAKKECYPKNIRITETSCQVPLQDLLDHTIIRILKIPNIKMPENIVDNIELLCKWGCDGSSDHSQYKQTFNESSSLTTTDYDVFMFSVVPLQLHFTDEGGGNHILWKNPRYSSTRFCRPIKFDFIKETVKSTQEGVEAVKSEIINLHPTIYLRGIEEVKIKHTMIFSMIDGKVANSVTQTSSQTCFICGCTPKDMNKFDNMDKYPVKPETFSYGLSTLHAYIRFLECILHISYRLDFQT
ncbi:hypothetical protein AGLY_017178 [Aphis glycines]|uniref:V(D)J recombination-activating protein 1 RNase H domain-containing protein n=1 Tax=Aphis glycines TaxID=307491 RepID=A0A6G0SVS1_APHGL|nr:hypothetical protein AGLY_017178 [Aphis glycines]